jgi:hypothetical protein
MGTFKAGKSLRRLLTRSPEFEVEFEFEPDYPLDNLIRDALLDDTSAYPSAGAWERLRRQVMIERQCRRTGMWLLDEPLRDPPEAPPLQLNYHDYKRALRIYSGQTTVTSRRTMMYKTTLWDGMIPSLSAQLNW